MKTMLVLPLLAISTHVRYYFINNVKINKHLHDIPSAKNVGKNSIGIGEMHTKLLQKIEELTSYIIDLQNKVQNLQTQMP